MKSLLLFLALACSFHINAQDQLYKVSLLRAKPGELLRLIDEIKSDIENYENLGIEKPFLLRHSQGDHWDLMLIHPTGSMSDYFSKDQLGQRSESKTIEKSYGNTYFDIISFQEEAIVQGPAKNEFLEACEKYKLFHIEIFTALPGKQKELLAQREAENVFYAEIDHRPNFIFTRVFGPSWDNFTIGFYDDLHDFAGPAVPFEKEDEAAKKAGFEGVNYIGSYLRSLISGHHDTLAYKVN